LNIAQCAVIAPRCTSDGKDGFIAQVLWYNELAPWTDWLEIGETGGITYGNPPTSLWERWTYWLDGIVLMLHPIAPKGADSTLHVYEIQQISGASWDVYIDYVRQGGVTNWDPPTVFTNWQLPVGLEVKWNAFAPVGMTNEPTFESDMLQVRDIACCAWRSWPSFTSQIDSPCPTVSPCMNGTYTAGFASWRQNKPN
jgi:hypothetical protein